MNTAPSSSTFFNETMPELIETSTPETTTDPIVIEEHDGALVNELTGEVLGFRGAPFTPPPIDAVGTDLTSEENLARLAEREEQLRQATLWATERRARAEAALKAKIYERDTLIAGINERFEGQINEQKRRIAWIDASYGPAMREFAKSQLEGSKQKSVKLPWATLGYRASKGAVEVTDAPRAAFTLLIHDLLEPIQVTVSLGALAAAIKADENDGESSRGVQSILLEAITDAFNLNVTDDGELQSVDLIDGVSVSITAGKVPDEIPETVKGVERKKPEDPLGTFYVKHG